jgi:hypothetical protein
MPRTKRVKVRSSARECCGTPEAFGRCAQEPLDFLRAATNNPKDHVMLSHFSERALHILLGGTGRRRPRDRVGPLPANCLDSQSVEVNVDNWEARGLLLRQRLNRQRTVYHKERNKADR